MANNRGTQYTTHGAPPPPYAPTMPTFVPSPNSPPRMPDYNGPRPDETTSLVNTDKRRKQTKDKFLHYAVATLFILMVISFWSAAPMVSSAVRHEIAEWERVHDQMVRDIELLRDEKRKVSDDLAILRFQRDEQRREWELEQEEHEKRRRGHVPFWGQARLLTAQCPSDRFRRYDARMYNLLVEDDWFAACMKEPIKIAGRTLHSPRSCINHGLDNGVRGYWSIEVNTRECPRTIWDRLRNIFG